ncbi:hypothetical protein ACIP93_37510 [Streptomyces sp. NPDC088745]|uniref:hypothetical protein n=1 Tax=Streptomyces sp. NPDC088745 TaxID=3365884 RepID=UPI00383017EB
MMPTNNTPALRGGRPRTTGVERLAAAAMEAPEVLRGWPTPTSTPGVTMVPCGVAWDCIVVKEGAGRRVADLLPSHDSAPGPVVADNSAGRAYFLVPKGTATRWTPLSGTEAHGSTTTWIGIPTPSGPRTTRAEWVVPPDGRGTLTDPAALRAAVAALLQEHGTLGAAATARQEMPR